MSQVHVHKVYEMGRAPYRFVGLWSAPSTAVAEHNPTAYSMAMAGKPKACTMSCAHCGTGIIHHCIIADADGKQYAVGTSCIRHLDQADLVSAVEAAQRKLDKQVRRAKQAAKLEARRQADMRELDAQRERNGGLTDAEMEAAWKRAEKKKAARAFEAAAKYFLDALRIYTSDFCKSVDEAILNGYLPSGRGEKIMLDIAAKYHGGRYGSRAYEIAHEYGEKEIEKLKSSGLFR